MIVELLNLSRSRGKIVVKVLTVEIRIGSHKARVLKPGLITNIYLNDSSRFERDSQLSHSDLALQGTLSGI